MRLRVKDLDFGQRQILVRDAKAGEAWLSAALWIHQLLGVDLDTGGDSITWR